MQQFFTNLNLEINNYYDLDKEVLYQLKKVLRAKNGYEFRLISNTYVFLARYEDEKAFIIERLNENNELDIDITAIISIIKQDKLELTLQKLTELGVKRIIPLYASRSQYNIESDNKYSRFNKIITEASEQSHRNIIPKLYRSIKFKDIDQYLSDINIVAYEKQDFAINKIDKAKSYTFVIGPEGGFTIEEIEYLEKLNFSNISLGSRILRAETAAIYLTSTIINTNI